MGKRRGVINHAERVTAPDSFAYPITPLRGGYTAQEGIKRMEIHPGIDLQFGDCETGLAGLQDGTVDLYVTSPPYNAGFDYGEMVNDCRPWPEYYRWLGRMFRIMHAKAAPGARLALNVPYQVSHSGKRSQEPHKEALAANAMRIAIRAGWTFREWIPWRKGEVAHGKRTAWGDFCNPSSPHYCGGALEEAVIIMHKGEWIKRKPGKRCNDITKEEWIDWLRNPWNIDPANDKGHPAKFPVELARRPILLYTHRGDLVVDPFMGSGTVGVACYQTGRRFVGFEINPAFVKVAAAALSQVRFSFEGVTPL